MLSHRALIILGGVAAVVSVIALASGLAGVATKDDPGVDVNFSRAVGTTVVFSDLVGAPSSAPSISMMPSLAPSTIPSSAPSSMPSLAPSSMPSDLPSVQPSSVPSISWMPSSFPSSVPSLQPSHAPTSAPSSVPTISMMPTFREFDESKKFRLKMYWKRGYRWQDDSREQKWCAMCTRCSSLNFSASGRSQGCRDSRSCRSGSQLYIRDCSDGHGSDFRIENYDDGYLLRMDDTDNCVERTKDKYLTLQRCNPSEKRQKWQKFSQDHEFELRPVYDRPEKCVTQQHHPKSYEVLGLEDCKKTRGYKVGKWEMYKT